MSQFTLISTLEQLDAVIQSSNKQPVLLFKHSTQCPISANALAELEQFSHTEDAEDVLIRVVHVIEDRPVSNEIADRYQIKHESPQAFWIKDEQVLWHASHRAITSEALKASKVNE